MTTAGEFWMTIDSICRREPVFEAELRVSHTEGLSARTLEIRELRLHMQLHTR